MIGTDVLNTLTLIGGIILVLLMGLYFSRKKFQKVYKFVYEKRLLFSFIVAFAAMCGSLYFSEIAKFVPCELCWFQRIFMYSMAVFLLVALLSGDKKNENYRKYALTFSIVGGCISVYHYAIQRISMLSFSCSGGVTCETVYSMGFGYITIPMMALTAFLLIIVMNLYRKN